MNIEPVASILIIEDEPNLRLLYKKLLEREGYNATTAHTLQQANELLLKHTYDLILSDVKLPDGKSTTKVKSWHVSYPQTAILLLTAYATVEDAVLAIKNGAYDYLIKGDNDSQLIPTIAAALASIVKTNTPVTAKSQIEVPKIVLTSASMQAIIKLVDKVAPTDLPILLLGESGTGKEVLAQYIHNIWGPSKPFVAINCAAFPPDMIESELFGYAKGAFTGAVTNKIGYVEKANGGTLFLDEIGEMSLSVQTKVLRLLENGEYYKLGDTKLYKSNFRLIAATNQQLLNLIDKKAFRLDLYHRINDFVINIPPLRQRIEDIEELSKNFINTFCEANNQLKKLSVEALNALKRYDWPGNIRQLRKTMHRCVVLSDKSVIDLEELPLEIINTDIKLKMNDDNHLWSISALEKRQIEKALAFTGGNRNEASKLLGIGIATIFRKIKEYGIAT